MRTKQLTISILLFLAGMLVRPTQTLAQPSPAKQPAGTTQFSIADEDAIRGILKEQETNWNKHDVAAFTKAFRDDAQGINAVGMYWQGKPVILKHLTDMHATFLKNCKEYLEETHVHSTGGGYAVSVSIWKVDAFTGPGPVEFPACRHRSTQLLVKGKDGWQVVHFHNTTIDEAALRMANVSLPPK